MDASLLMCFVGFPVLLHCVPELSNKGLSESLMFNASPDTSVTGNIVNKMLHSNTAATNQMLDNSFQTTEPIRCSTNNRRDLMRTASTLCSNNSEVQIKVFSS